MGLKHVKIQLADSATGEAITSSGGKCYVAKTGDSAKETLYTAAGASLSNPITPTNGMIEFWTDDTVAKVDLYGYGPSGHPFYLKNVVGSGPNEHFINTQQRVCDLVIPFAQADFTANTETSSGFVIPTNAMVLPSGIAVEVKTIDATETIDVGILSTEAAGDANGFVAAASLATAIMVPAVNVITAGATETYFSSTTLGALVNDFLAGANVAGDVGSVNPKPWVCDGTSKTVTYTTSAGSDTGKGFIHIPLILAA